MKFFARNRYWQAALFFSLFVSGVFCWARPEYAVRYGINRCTACHFSPAGGGPRNLNGKYFGAFGYKPNLWMNQDFAGAEIKMLYYRPSRQMQNTKSGLGLMNGSVWGSVAMQKLEGDSPEIRVVAEQNLGGFSPGPRQWYGRLTFAPDTETTWYPQYILVGRIIPAFGAMTDEHLTYVRMQSSTTWNVGGFDTGIMMSANPVESLHYDLALANGQKNTGQALSQGMADIWGATLNLRWLPVRLPVSIGASGSWYGASATENAPTAFSVYSLLSFYRMTNNHVPMTLTAEFVQAQNWNDTFTSFFVNDSNYASSVSKSTSRGFYGLLEYEFTRRFIAQYKYDQLILDRDFPADAYQRHGVGVKYYFGNNMWTILRFEKAYAGRPGESSGNKFGAMDDVWAVVSLSI